MIGPFVFEDVSSEPNSGFGAIAEEISHKLIPNWISFTVQFAAMVIMILVIFFVAYKPVKKIIKKRQDYIESNIREAEESKAIWKENELKSKETVLASDRTAANIVAEAKANATIERNKILEQTQEDVARMKLEAENDIARMELEAQDKIRKEIVSVALDASKELLGREVSSEDNNRLLEEFIEDVKRD